MFKVLISLGSNLGNKNKFLYDAKRLISKNHKILKESSLMSTGPIGDIEQDDFLNQIILVETIYAPKDLLKDFKRIEKILGRKKRKKWDKREIDIDIITYEDFHIETELLTIPHKELLNRKFVILGACEILPDYEVEKINLSFKDIKNKYLKQIDKQKVVVL